MRAFILLCFVAMATATGVYKATTNKVPDQYIVKLKDGAKLSATMSGLNAYGDVKILHQFKSVFPGFSAQLSNSMVKALLDDDAVEYVEENGIVHAMEVSSWGLDRIDQINFPLDNTYTPIGSGEGVNVYVIDTGVFLEHVDFEGRASFAFDSVGDDGIDCNGHGTHCAGTVAGASFGVAKSANIHAVRVLNCEGSGSTAGVIAGCEYVANNAMFPAVASMSLGGSASQAMDDAIQAMTDASVTVVVAAGNEDSNACGVSPARAPSAITVGATTDTDTRAYFSNYGGCLDIFAPGVAITSAWINSPTANNTISGTSMACPHVAGASAIMLQMNPSLSPEEVTAQLQLKAMGGRVIDAKTYSPNLLLYMGVGEGGGGFIPPPYDDGCGGTFTDKSGTIRSQNYPEDYPNSMSCEYLIGGTGGAVSLEFLHFDIENHLSCAWDVVKIYDGPNSSANELAAVCGTELPGPFVSSGDSLYITATSDSIITRSGFLAQYTIETLASCGHHFDEDDGTLASSNFPGKYKNEENCMISIGGMTGESVTLSFDHFEVEKHTGCSYDKLEIYDGDSDQGNLLFTLCGYELPADVVSSPGMGLFLKFTSDESVTRTGFKAHFLRQ